MKRVIIATFLLLQTPLLFGVKKVGEVEIVDCSGGIFLQKINKKITTKMRFSRKEYKGYLAVAKHCLLKIRVTEDSEEKKDLAIMYFCALHKLKPRPTTTTPERVEKLNEEMFEEMRPYLRRTLDATSSKKTWTWD